MKKRQIRIDGDIAYVPLQNGMEAKIDADDAQKTQIHNWCIDKHGYAVTNVAIGAGKHRTVRLHRVLIDAPAGMEVDHIHGNKLDNRKSQLRLATKAQNGCNRGAQVNNTSGFKGVVCDTSQNTWKAQIEHQKKKIHLGCYTTPESAHQAYCEAATRLHGEFANVGLVYA